MNQKAKANISDLKASTIESSTLMDTDATPPESATENVLSVTASVTVTTDPPLKSSSQPLSPRPRPPISYALEGLNNMKTTDNQFKFPGRSLQSQLTKPNSLAQQLDNVRQAGTEIFLSNVLTTPIVPVNEVSDSNVGSGSKPGNKNAVASKKVRQYNPIPDTVTVASDVSSPQLMSFNAITSPKTSMKRGFAFCVKRSFLCSNL